MDDVLYYSQFSKNHDQLFTHTTVMKTPKTSIGNNTVKEKKAKPSIAIKKDKPIQNEWHVKLRGHQGTITYKILDLYFLTFSKTS